MAFPKDFIDALCERADIADLIGGYTELKRRGSTLWGRCPFHNEKTPSFTVAPDKGVYHCFGCGEGGGVLTFIQKAENLGFADAVRFLADKVGMRVPEDAGDEDGFKFRTRLFALHTDAARFFHNALEGGRNPAAAEYVRSRGLSAGAVRRFGLGAAPGDWTALLDAMKGAGYGERELSESGLFTNKDGRLYDRFRNRLMFPIIDTRGRVTAFGGRLIGEGQPKYLNSPETPIFSKSRNLFALNFAKKSKLKGLILAEGYMDVVSLHAAGFDNAVASLGTALTEYQAKLISERAEVVLAYDMDDAGRKAAERAAGILARAGVKTSVLVLDGAKDPDEFIRKRGREAFKSRLDGSETHTAYRLSVMKNAHDTDSDDGKVAFLKEAAALLAGIPNAMEREVYISRAAETANISRVSVESEVNRLRKNLKKRAEYREEVTVITALNGKAALEELEFTRCLFCEPGLFGRYADLTEDDFTVPWLKTVWAHIAGGGFPGLDALSGILGGDALNKLAGAITRPLVSAEETADDCYIKIKKRRGR